MVNFVETSQETATLHLGQVVGYRDFFLSIFLTCFSDSHITDTGRSTLTWQILYKKDVFSSKAVPFGGFVVMYP
jgi:hypothetical protein